MNGVIVTSLYAPTGNPQPGPKFVYKLAWLQRLAAHAADLYAADVPVVLAGDYNVVPTDRDIYPTKSWTKDALVQPESRAAFRRILAQGWVDGVRAMHPDTPMYTYWDYKRNRWPRDAGLRIDHLLLSGETAKRLEAAGVDRDVRGEDGASDHAPAWIVLGDDPQTPGCRAPDRNRRAKPGSAEAAGQGNGAKPAVADHGWRPLRIAYHAVPKTILRKGKKGAGAIVGFANFLLRLYESEKPRAVLVGWDTLDAPTYRHLAFPAYQSGRQFDDALVEQLAALPELVAACGFANAKAAGYEADDFLAAAVAAEERRGGTVLVASGDRDTFQLASATTTILYPLRAGEMARIGPAQVRERYGVEPRQVPDFISLRGDPSDKLPGASGVGPKGAADLIRCYGALEEILAASRFATQAEMRRLFRSIATMNAAAPLPPLADQVPTWTKAAVLARAWELNRLAERLEGMGGRKPA